MEQNPSTQTQIVLEQSADSSVWWCVSSLATDASHHEFLLAKLEERGQAGDLYGSINALFSGLAFAGVIVAILLQREELALQRQELTLTRKELSRAATAQDEAQKALNKTMYAQTYKVALDILDSAESTQARAYIASRWENSLRKLQPREWPTDTKEKADTLIRGLEAVGTFVVRGLIPGEYVLSTRSANIVKNWEMVEDYVEFVRGERGDSFFATDFSKLAQMAQQFLDGEEDAADEASE